jgi:hypothetical protein
VLDGALGVSVAALELESGTDDAGEGGGSDSLAARANPSVCFLTWRASRLAVSGAARPAVSLGWLSWISLGVSGAVGA